MKAFAIFTINVLIATSLYAQMDERFYFPKKEWKSMEGISFEEVYLDVDSVKLNGIFLKPEGTAKATVLLFHGAGGNVSSYVYMAEPLLNHGFQVFMIDFRGYGKSTGKPSHANIASDGQKVFDYLLGRSDVKGLPLMLLGASMGSQIATKLTRDNQHSVSALILDSPLSSFTDIALHHAPVEHHAAIKQIPFPYSASEDIAKIKDVPTLIIHSKEDKEAPFAGAQKLYDAAQQPRYMWVYSGSHIDAANLYPDKYAKRIATLLSKQ